MAERIVVRRVATPSECWDFLAALIRRLDRRCMGDDPVDPAGAYWWLAFVDGQTAAYAGLEYAGYDDRAFLCRVGVLPRFRGRGLQRRLIRVREAQARRLGWGTCITYVAPDNVASANNLIGCGYRLYRPEAEWGVRGSIYLWRRV